MLRLSDDTIQQFSYEFLGIQKSYVRNNILDCWISEIKTDFAYSMKMKSLKLCKIDLDQYNR